MRPKNRVTARTATTATTASDMGSSISAWCRRKISLTSRFTSMGTSPLMALVNSMQKMASAAGPTGRRHSRAAAGG